MKKVRILLFVFFVLIGIAMNYKAITVYASEDNTKVKELNGITTYYRSYCYTKSGSYITNGDNYWRTDAFDYIWKTSNSWKGFVLEDRNGSVSVANCAGVVLSNEAGYYPIKIDFSTAYYQLAYGHAKNNKEYVKGVQQALLWLGYNIGKTGVDGDFGYNTEQAVKAFQRNHGLTVDGVVGKNTYLNLSFASF